MPKQFFRQTLCILLFFALLIIWIGRYTDVDLRLADAMFRPTGQVFPWKDNWFAEVFMHHWVKYCLIIAGVSIVGLLMVDLYRSSKWLDYATRTRLVVVALSFIIVPTVISILKSQSIHHCPWDLQRYGGYAPYLRLFDSLPDGMKGGHCFPAGHASSGLWLAAFFVFWLPGRPGMAYLMFLGGLLPGLMLGWVQQLRGAHFLTHTLWSAWIASFLILILARLILSKGAVTSCAEAQAQKFRN